MQKVVKLPQKDLQKVAKTIDYILILW